MAEGFNPINNLDRFKEAQARRKEKNKERIRAGASEKSDSPLADRMASFNEGVNQSRIEKKEKEAEEKKKKIKPKQLTQAQLASAAKLRNAWCSCCLTFPFSVLYILFHWVAVKLGFKSFIQIGSEWFATPFTKNKADLVKKKGQDLKDPEEIAIGFIFFILIMSVVSVLVLVVLIYCSMDTECAVKMTWELIKATWNKVISFFESD